MKKALVVGGANGIGLGIATELAKRDDIQTVHIIDKAELSDEFSNYKFMMHQFDLTQSDYSLFDSLQDIDILMITAGFGKLDLFIPQYDEVFRHVLERYHADFRKEGAHSYDYKTEHRDNYKKHS